MIKKYKQIVSRLKNNFDRRWTVGLCLTLSGCAGLGYFLFSVPPVNGPILESAKWAFGTTFFMILAFSGFPGMLHRRLTAMDLKILDLIWVLATAGSVAFGVVYVYERSADIERKALEKNIETSRGQAARNILYAYRLHCDSPNSFTVQQCEALRTLSIVVNSQGYLSQKMVQSVCQLPIDIGNPPAGFSQTLIEGCIMANYAAATASDPIFLDKENVERWRIYLNFWPILLIVLVALRVTKSIAEVFWKIK